MRIQPAAKVILAAQFKIVNKMNHYQLNIHQIIQ